MIYEFYADKYRNVSLKSHFSLREWKNFQMIIYFMKYIYDVYKYLNYNQLKNKVCDKVKEINFTISDACILHQPQFKI